MGLFLYLRNPRDTLKAEKYKKSCPQTTFDLHIKGVRELSWWQNNMFWTYHASRLDLPQPTLTLTPHVHMEKVGEEGTHLKVSILDSADLSEGHDSR